ncbi:hypothetical protein [Kibdelosporangium phytohabitans]|nr:hypothetical protein [Kibdelosporangium phytohabitans]MBE1471914.1 hypothetical protein [Kibdelosporangium phytohabitans]
MYSVEFPASTLTAIPARSRPAYGARSKARRQPPADVPTSRS